MLKDYRVIAKSEQGLLPNKCNECLLFIQHKIASFSSINVFNVSEMVVAVLGLFTMSFGNKLIIKLEPSSDSATVW